MRAMVKRAAPTARKRRDGKGRARISASEVVARLEAEGPLPDWRPHRDPLGELALTLLSQNTSDTNSGRAYQQLLGRYGSWDEVIAAPVQEVEETIRVGGLAKTKAPRMQALLSQVRAELGPEWSSAMLSERLAALPIEDAEGWLTTLPGIGPKTAACVLLFSEGRPALPVDTHVHRVSQRLGLIGSKVGAVEAHAALEGQLPPEEYYGFHVSMIRHGRRVCKAQRPLCASCVLSDRCPSVFLER